MAESIKYCYLIGWSEYDKYYYGMQCGKKCHPKNLMVTYFTSSKRVKSFINKYGLPDIIQVRKLFTDRVKVQ